MKKTLFESLVDYDIAVLTVLATTRGVTLGSQHPISAARELAAQLLSPTSVAIAVADLSPDEGAALAMLQTSGGWVESPRFARRFGSVRPMGPGRLARERPWQTPANPTEALWYRGLIFQGFRPGAERLVESFYIPDDLLALLPEPPAPEPAPGMAPADGPAHVQTATAALVEDVFHILVYLRRRPLHLDAAGSPAAHDLQAINALFVRPLAVDQLAPAVAGGNRLGLLLQACRAAGLTISHAQRLAVSRERARAWLQASPGRRLFELQTAWRQDGEWNDLRHVSSLKIQDTGWRNDPLLARQAVLACLATCRPLVWYRVEDLVATVKRSDPDFQRPDGDYSTWYIHDLRDRPLMGFEHWDEVEGALIRHLVTCPLYWLGAVDLGSETEDGAPATCRVSRAAASLLGQATVAAAESPGAEESPDARFIVRDDFSVHAAPDARLVDRFQLARFADIAGREGETAIYRISPGGVNLAGKQGIGVAQISAFLLRITGRRVPPRVLEALERWQKVGAARLERTFILHLDGPEMLAHLRRDTELSALLGGTIGPSSVLIPATHEQRVRRWLTEHGYL